MLKRSLTLIFLALTFAGCGSGFNAKNSSDPAEKVTGNFTDQCSESFMDDLNQILLSKERAEKTQNDRNLKAACSRFNKLYQGKNCFLKDGGQNRTVNTSEIQKICQQPLQSHPPQPSPTAPLVRNLKELRLTVKDQALATKMLFQKSDKINSAMVRGNITRSADLARHLKEGRTVCVLLSANIQLPESNQTLRSSKILEKPTLSRGFSTLLHLQVLTTWKDQFYSLHCEKTGFMSTADIQSSVGEAFVVSPL